MDESRDKIEKFMEQFGANDLVNMLEGSAGIDLDKLLDLVYQSKFLLEKEIGKDKIDGLVKQLAYYKLLRAMHTYKFETSPYKMKWEK